MIANLAVGMLDTTALGGYRNSPLAIRRRQLRHRTEIHARPLRWVALPVEELERAFGRSKLEDIEMPDTVKPINSHVALNTIVKANGVQRQIMRDKTWTTSTASSHRSHLPRGTRSMAKPFEPSSLALPGAALSTFPNPVEASCPQ